MAFNPNSNSSTNYNSNSSTNYNSNSSTNYNSNSSTNYNSNSSTNYNPTPVPNYVNYANYVNHTIPCMMNGEVMMKMFQEYKESCRVRLESCVEDRSRVSVLECMVTELLEQNELLLNSLIEYGNQSKDSLITSTTSFGSNYSSASFDSGYNQMVSTGPSMVSTGPSMASTGPSMASTGPSMVPPQYPCAQYLCAQYNPYTGQSPLQTHAVQKNSVAKCSSVQKSPAAHAQERKSSYTSSKVGACSVKDECNETSDSTIERVSEVKTINEKMKYENRMLTRENDSLKVNEKMKDDSLKVNEKMKDNSLKVNEKMKDENRMLTRENDSLKETNERLVSANRSLEQDVSDVREENDNLRHDIANLVYLIKEQSSIHQLRNKDGHQDGHGTTDQDGHGTTKKDGHGTTKKDGHQDGHGATRLHQYLTFCDSVSPEDIYGPIESLKDLELTEHDNVTEEHDNFTEEHDNFTEEHDYATEEHDYATEEHDNVTEESNVTKEPDNITKLSCKNTEPDPSRNGNDRKHDPKANRRSVALLDLMEEKKPNRRSVALVHLMEEKKPNRRSVAFLHLLEEKESLINRLQMHLEEVTKQVSVRDEVIKKIEEKLLNKRKECEEWIKRSMDVEVLLNESTKKYVDLKTREHTLMEDKRELISRLANESDACIQAREDNLILKRQLADVIKQNQYQSMTIEHLKEALVSTKNAVSSIGGSSHGMTSIGGSSHTVSSIGGSSHGIHNSVTSHPLTSCVTSVSNTAFGMTHGSNYGPKTVINKSTPHLGGASSGTKSTSFKLDHV